jgi:hypothetical protein
MEREALCLERGELVRRVALIAAAIASASGSMPEPPMPQKKNGRAKSASAVGISSIARSVCSCAD